MGLRQNLEQVIADPAARVVEEPVQAAVEAVLRTRSFADRAGFEAVRERVFALEASAGATPGDVGARLSALDASCAQIRERLADATRSITTATTELLAVRQVAGEALTTCRQAAQHATSARNAAEAATDGLATLTQQIEALERRLAG